MRLTSGAGILQWLAAESNKFSISRCVLFGVYWISWKKNRKKCQPRTLRWLHTTHNTHSSCFRKEIKNPADVFFLSFSLSRSSPGLYFILFYFYSACNVEERMFGFESSFMSRKYIGTRHDLFTSSRLVFGGGEFSLTKWEMEPSHSHSFINNRHKFSPHLFSRVCVFISKRYNIFFTISYLPR